MILCIEILEYLKVLNLKCNLVTYNHFTYIYYIYVCVYVCEMKLLYKIHNFAIK